MKNEASSEGVKQKKINWSKIKHDYVTGELTYRELAEKYGVSIESIKKQARKTDKKQGWVTLKRKHRNNVYTKAQQKSEVQQSNEIVNYRKKIKSESERLIEKVSEAVMQLSEHLVEHETVVKTNY